MTRTEVRGVDDSTENETAETAEIAETVETVETVETTETTEAAPRDRAARLEAKAARLREREEAKRAAEEAKRAAQPAGRSDRTRPAAGWIAATILLAVLLVLAVVAGLLVTLHFKHESDAAHALNRERTTVTRLSTQYATDFGSYNYQTFDADSARIKTHLTGQTLQDYTKTIAGLRTVIVQTKAVETAKVLAVAVETISSRQASVLVMIDQTQTSSLSTTPRIDRNRLRLTMQRQKDGTWLVANLENV